MSGKTSLHCEALNNTFTEYLREKGSKQRRKLRRKLRRRDGKRK